MSAAGLAQPTSTPDEGTGQVVLVPVDRPEGATELYSLSSKVDTVRYQFEQVIQTIKHGAANGKPSTELDEMILSRSKPLLKELPERTESLKKLIAELAALVSDVKSFER